MAKHPGLCLECTLRKYCVQSRCFGWLFLGRRESILSNSHIFSVTSMLVPKTKGGCLASVPGFGVPGRCLEVRCVDVLIVAGVYVIGGLTGGHHFFWWWWGVRIFLRGYLFVWLQYLGSKEEFLFINSPRGFQISLGQQRSHFIDYIHFFDALINDLSFLSNRYQHPLNPSWCLYTKLSQQFSQFIRPNNFIDTTWWLQNTKLFSRRFY